MSAGLVAYVCREKQMRYCRLQSRFIKVLLILILPVSGHSQKTDIKFRHLNEGLSQSTILYIFQDSKGFMWFGTYHGLNRYDGTHFKIYENVVNDSSSISHNWIRTIYEDSKNNLWIGTYGGGLDLYDRNNDNFIRYAHYDRDPYSLSNNLISCIHEDSKGNLWIGTVGGGLDLFDRDKNNFTHFKFDDKDSDNLADNNINEIYEDSHGNLWICSGKDKLSRYDENTNSFIRCELNQPGVDTSDIIRFTSMIEDNTGTLWIGSVGGGLFSLRSDSLGQFHFNQYLHDDNDSTSLSNNDILILGLDKNDNLWIGTENGGLNLFDRRSRNFYKYRHDPNDENSIGSNSIWSIYKDRAGRVWIGTFDSGLDVIDDYYYKFDYYRHKKDTNSLSHDNVRNILEDEDGNLWIGIDGGGLNYFERNKNSFAHYRHDTDDTNSISKNAVLALCQDSDDNIWVGCWAGGISVFDKSKKTFAHYNSATGSLKNNNVYSLLCDDKGDIFIGTWAGGVGFYSGEKNQFTHYVYDKLDSSSLTNNNIEYLYQDRMGKVWIATSGGGLNLFHKDKTGKVSFTHYQHKSQDANSLSDNFVQTIFEDSQNNFWIGTTSGGLNLMDRKRGTFTHFRKEDGLPSNTICSILEDDEGNLWISTDNGLSKFNPNSKRFRNYDASDGLPGNEFNKNAACKGRDGKLFFGSRRGLVAFYPDSVYDKLFIPPVYLTDFKIFNVPVKIGARGSPLQKHISETRELTLSHKHSVFTFEFIALNYTHGEENQYAFMLEGLEREWNYVGTRHTATYTNLDAGQYVFRVKAANDDGVWNEKGLSLKITVTPPFWQTWWFRGFGIAALFLLFGTVYWSRTRSIRIRNKLLEVRVAERTGELHQEIIERKRVEESLRKAHDDLEIRVAERTAELATANQTLHVEISERKKAETQITNSLKEKEVLLKEIHHRVKNNMQVISSLLSLQSRYIKDEQVQKAFMESQGRVRSMALIHEKLYQSEDLSRIDFAEYVRNLADYLSSSYGVNSAKIALKTDVDGMSLGINTAIPCGLIINELVSNSLKHAFPGDRNGEIRIDLHQSDGEYELVVSDNGVGLPKDVDFRNAESLGLQLVNSLTNQLDGTIEIEDGDGVSFRIVFADT